MTVESVSFIGDLDPAKPGPSDPKSEGDDHLRNLKKALQNSVLGLATASTDGGAVNSYTITPANPLPSYGTRMAVVFSPSAANTGAATLNISGLGAKSIVSVSGAVLQANDLMPGQIYIALYDGTKFRLISVTKNYVDQLAYAGSVPGVTDPANAGKFLGSDGTGGVWGDPRPFGDDAALAQVHAIATATASL